MIVQTAGPGQPAFVMTMAEHTQFAAALAEHFGNEVFAEPAPRDLVLYLIAHHDAGWAALDARALRDPDTGLPFHLVHTPLAEIAKTSSASPDFNVRHHPYCGLLSSMHSWGLYNGRFGMSDKLLLDALQDEQRELLAPMLKHEEARQRTLTSELETDPHTGAWVERGALMQNYKLLQFCDTLALYFNCTAEGRRERSVFTHVPVCAERDTDVEVTPLGDAVYAFDPWPFAQNELALSFSGRVMNPVATGDSVREQLDAAPVAEQAVVLRRASN